MNDDELITLLRSAPEPAGPLDPSKVIAGAYRRRRLRVAAGGVVACAAVVAVAATGVVLGGGPARELPIAPPVASTPSPVLTPSARYTFRNTERPIATVPVTGEAPIAGHLFFATRGTRWAVISRAPGASPYEPFGWRKTVGNPNLADARQPGVQSVGAVQTSVFRGERVSTVVYTRGSEAWYGQVNRLAGIPGWIAVWADLKAASQAPGERVSVFAYSADGTLLARYGDAPEPLLR
ncbi:hypothetical protein Kfla_0336 [Kribbella flavida DSM 17836]|uniref:Uncharacterized protein n=1 Tax=Kribbella flavida (strain DSM 17836 / JCM 10339 / NBRC 14399) TaxID=479435 RepID=D2PTE4_KRIFD|nr:hypothetical protein [Kribbella flavida]ADB29460.1 hypothetical protein Kfla_0336 [Kribbella flavida DSM 17836]